MKQIETAALLCELCMKEDSPLALQKLKMICRQIGHDMMRLSRLVPPDSFVIADTDYDGGQIQLSKTTSRFCTRGRSLDQVVGRRRIRSARKVEFLVIYDDSNSMTAWWRSEYLRRRIHEYESPQTMAKIALLSLLETFAKNASASIIFFGSKADAPSKSRNLSYRALVRMNGSGGTRLDEALRVAIEKRWHRRGGRKYVVILTDGVPEAGNEKDSEDSYIQSKAISYLDVMQKFGVRVLFSPILTDAKLAYKEYGEYNARTFAQELRKRGATVKITEKLADLPVNVFTGVKEMISK